MSDSPNRIERPRTLTFICRLSFISCIWGLWVQSDRLWIPGAVATETRAIFEQVQENIEAQSNEANAEFIEKIVDSVREEATPETIRISAIIMLIYESLTLYGAYMMWSLQKRGFYLYLAGIGVVILGPLLLMGGWLGFMTMFGGAFFSIIFAFFYRAHLKYMF